MALKDGNRIQEVTTTTGTSNLSLSGAPAGYNAFSSKIASTEQCMYWLFDADGLNWECGVGTMSGTATLQRTTVIDSSNNGNKIVLSTGSHTVCIGPVAGKTTGDLNLTYNLLKEAVITDYRETAYAISQGTGTLTLNQELGNIWNVTQTANFTLALPSGLDASTACSFTLYITLGGAYTLTLPSIKWVNGATPTLSTTSGKINAFTFITLDGGSTWLGNYLGSY